MDLTNVEEILVTCIVNTPDHERAHKENPLVQEIRSARRTTRSNTLPSGLLNVIISQHNVSDAHGIQAVIGLIKTTEGLATILLGPEPNHNIGTETAIINTIRNHRSN